jgi:hypothetical protein
MKAYKGSRVTAPLILNLGTTWSWVANFTPWPLSPQESIPVPIDVLRYYDFYLNIKAHISHIMYTSHVDIVIIILLYCVCILKYELLYSYRVILILCPVVLYCLLYVSSIISLTQDYPNWRKCIHTRRSLNNMWQASWLEGVTGKLYLLVISKNIIFLPTVVFGLVVRLFSRSLLSALIMNAAYPSVTSPNFWRHTQ